jgi:hypothetical protein
MASTSADRISLPCIGAFLLVLVSLLIFHINTLIFAHYWSSSDGAEDFYKTITLGILFGLGWGISKLAHRLPRRRWFMGAAASFSLAVYVSLELTHTFVPGLSYSSTHWALPLFGFHLGWLGALFWLAAIWFGVGHAVVHVEASGKEEAGTELAVEIASEVGEKATDIWHHFHH